MAKLSLQDVAKVLTEKSGLSSRQANKFISEMFAIILERLQDGEQVKVKGFGTFKVIPVEPRESVNVRTGERILIEGHDKVTFAPDTMMKELVNKPFSQFDTVTLNDGVVFDDEQNDDKEEQIEDEEEKLPLEKRPLVDYVADNEPVTPPRTEPRPEPVTPSSPEPRPVTFPYVPPTVEPREEKRNAPQDGPIVEYIGEETVEPITEGMPLVDHPVVPKPKPVAPKVETPVVEEAPIVQPVEEEKTVDIPVVDIPVIDNPAVEGPADEKPADESPSVVEPVEDQPVVNNDDNGKKRTWVKWVFGILGVLILMGASSYLGFRLALKEMEPLLAKQEVKQPKVVKQPLDTMAVKDSVTLSVPMEASAPAKQAKPVEKVEPMAVGKPGSESNAETTEEKVDQYDAKDERVRHGAYRIVGTQTVVKVQPGQTFYSICRAHLGPEMECYVEVYNNLPPYPQVKTGQRIKIPKLVLKKKGKR